MASSLVLCFTLALAGLAVSNPYSNNPQNKPIDPIHAIRDRYNAINKNIRRYKTVKKSLSGFSAEGGELVAHLDKKVIVKMVATYYGETGRSIEEYYYSNGELIFVFRKQLNYDRPLTGKVVSSEQHRFYFDAHKLIKWINQDGKEVPSTDDEFSKQQQEFLENSELLLKGAHAKADTIEAP